MKQYPVWPVSFFMSEGFMQVNTCFSKCYYRHLPCLIIIKLSFPDTAPVSFQYVS